MSDYANEKRIKDNYTDRISLAQCREILNAKEYGYTDEEVLLIRDFLYSLAVVDFDNHERKAKQEANIIKIPIDYDNDAKKSYSLLPGKYRRTS